MLASSSATRVSIYSAALGWFLMQIMGVIGAALMTGLALLIGQGLIMNWYYHKKMGIDVIRFWKNIGRLCLAGVPAVIMGIGIMVFVEFDSILKFLLYIILLSLVYLLSMWILGMNREEKQMILGVWDKIRGKKKVCE